MAKEKSAASPPAKAAGRKFVKEQLRAHCQELFGVSPMVFDGALFDVRDEMTKDEAKRFIQAWLKQSAGAKPKEAK